MAFDTSTVSVSTLSVRRRFFGSEYTAVLMFAIVLAILAFVLQRKDWLLQGSIALTLALCATGLGLALGLAGEFVLGILVVFAAGAYTAAALTEKADWDFWPAAGVGVLIAIVVGSVLSLPGLRIGRFYFGMMGFFLVFLIPSIVEMFAGFTNGSRGLSVSQVPSIFGLSLDYRGMFVVAAVVLVVALLLTVNIRRSPLGTHMRRMRESSVVLASSGVRVWRIRLATYVLSSIFAGLGGVVFSHMSGFILPTVFSLETTNLLLAAVIVGGSRSLLGPTLGVLVLYIVPRVIINVEGYADLIYGVIVVASVLLFRGGVTQSIRDLADAIRRRRGVRISTGPDEAVVVRSPERLAELIWSLRSASAVPHTLTVRGVRKRYGGIAALDMNDDDEVSVKSGEVLVLLGPNGSGKTTMLNVLSGLVRPDTGNVELDGRPIPGMPVSSIARAGIGRSFQGPALPDEVTPIELFTTAIADMRHVSYFHWFLSDWVANRARRDATAFARQLAYQAGLGPAAAEPCRGLTSGQRRIVDVLLSLLSANSTLVLLDEPAAGLSDAERTQLATTVRALADRGIGFVLVEHDLDLAFNLADRVTIMAGGRPIAHGSATEMRESAVVREVLIGGVS